MVKGGGGEELLQSIKYLAKNIPYLHILHPIHTLNSFEQQTTRTQQCPLQ